MPRPPPATMTPGPRSVRSIAGRLEYRGFILDEPMRPPESAGPPDSKDRELIQADVVRGRRLTSWPSLWLDLRRADAEAVDEEVVIDGQFTTSRSR